MATERQAGDGVVLDVGGIVQAIKYYALIGAGLGVLGVILLFQFGAGDEGGSIISGLLSLVILAFAVLSGPLIAAFVGYATAGRGIGNIRARAVNSGIANGIGFAVFGIIVSAILWAGIAVLIGGGGDGGTASNAGGSSAPIELTKLVTLVILMMIPNSLVGGGITFFLEGRGGASSKKTATVAERQPTDENPSEGGVSGRVFGAVIIVSLLLVAGGLVASGVVTDSPGDATDANGDSAAESDTPNEAFIPPVNSTALQEADAERLESAGSYTIVQETDLERTGADGVSRKESFTASVDTDTDTVLTEFSTEGQTRIAYRTGSEKYERVEFPTGDPEYQIPDRNMSTAQYLDSALLDELETIDVEHQKTDAGHLYTASGVDAVSDGFYDASADSIQSFELEAVVSDQGVLTEASYRIEVETDSGSTTVMRTTELKNIGTTEVSEPTWLDDAREATN